MKSTRASKRFWRSEFNDGRKARKPKPQATPPSGTPRGMSGLSGLSGLATHGYK